MFGIENYVAFVFAGILLNITPGADTFYILTRSIDQGRTAGILSVCGIGCGALVHIAFAAFGLSTILATSSLAYSIVRYFGAAFLLYLGVSALVSRASGIAVDNNVPSKSISNAMVFRQGFLTNLLNPKIALFFLSFLPQFVASENAYGAIPFLILGFTFLTTGSIWCFFLALFASAMTTRLRQNQKGSNWLKRGCGAIFILLGLQVAIRD